MARWGLLLKLHGTSFENFNFNPRVCFFTITFAWFVRAVAHLTVLEAGLKIQRFNKRYDDFSHLLAKLLRHSVVVS